MDASLCVQVKTQSTYGPTIVAINQGSFMRGFIETVTSFTDLLIEDVLGKKDSLLWAVSPHLCQFIRFGGFNESTHVHIHTTHVPFVVYLANLTVLLGHYSLHQKKHSSEDLSYLQAFRVLISVLIEVSTECNM